MNLTTDLSEELGGPGFGLPPEGVSMVFPLLRKSTGVGTFRIGDLGFRIEINKA